MAKHSNNRRANSSRRNRVLTYIRETYSACWICGLALDKTAPQGTPLCTEADELVPVSQGGSAYDFANVRAAHRCCNNWRSNNSVQYVENIRRLVLSHHTYTSPLAFVQFAKAIEKQQKYNHANKKIIITTEW